MMTTSNVEQRRASEPAMKLNEASLTELRAPCHGTRRDGTPCRGTAMRDGYCFSHHPDAVETLAAARRRGGQNRSNAARLRGLVPPRLVPIFDRLEATLTGVLDGSLDPRQATAAASVARALVAVLQAGELESRVRRLEGDRTLGEEDDDGAPSSA